QSRTSPSSSARLSGTASCPRAGIAGRQGLCILPSTIDLVSRCGLRSVDLLPAYTSFVQPRMNANKREYYTLRFLGGLQPLCGIGVVSLIPRTSRPAVARARIADSRPEPGPLTRTSTVRRPTSLALPAAVIDACCAANGVPFRDPRKPSDPALDQEITFPS